MKSSSSRRGTFDHQGRSRSTRSALGSELQRENTEGKPKKQTLPLDKYESSTLDKSALEVFIKKVKKFGGFSLKVPGEDERPSLLTPPLKAFWFFQLGAGLRFPVPPFFARIAYLYNVPLNQLNPASIRKAAFFHIIASLEGVKDTTFFFFRTHELKHRDSHLYFSPNVRFANIYGKYESIDKDWHKCYLTVSPPPGVPWNIPDINLYRNPSKEKTSRPLPSCLSSWEEEIMSILLSEYPPDHTMLRPLVESEEILSFFGLKPSVPWSPLMGKKFLWCYRYFSIFIYPSLGV